jgi:hypothetical protein
VPASYAESPSSLTKRSRFWAGPDSGDPVRRNDQRQQVGIGEVAVIVRVLLAPHHPRLAGIRVEEHGGLRDLAAFLDFADLPLDLVVDGFLEEAEGVQVLDLAAGAEGLARTAHRDIGVAAEGAFLHVAVANADPAHQRVQRAGVGDGLVA